MPEVGFEPTRTIRPADLKSAPLDLSGIQAKKSKNFNSFDGSHGQDKPKKKNNAPAGNQTRVSSVAGTYLITGLPAPA